MSKPDETHELDRGWRVELYYRKSGGPGRGVSRIMKIIGPDGQTDEIWHEAFDDGGHLRHRHEIPVKRKEREP